MQWLPYLPASMIVAVSDLSVAANTHTPELTDIPTRMLGTQGQFQRELPEVADALLCD